MMEHFSASASAFHVPIFTSGPRLLRTALGSVAQAIIDNIHCDGQEPTPAQAEEFAKKWIFAEVSANGC